MFAEKNPLNEGEQEAPSVFPTAVEERVQVGAELDQQLLLGVVFGRRVHSHWPPEKMQSSTEGPKHHLHPAALHELGVVMPEVGHAKAPI